MSILTSRPSRSSRAPFEHAPRISRHNRRLWVTLLHLLATEQGGFVLVPMGLLADDDDDELLITCRA